MRGIVCAEGVCSHRQAQGVDLTSLTLGTFVEYVVVDVIVAAAQADADSVLDVGERVVVDFRVEGLQDGDTGVLHVVHVVI